MFSDVPKTGTYRGSAFRLGGTIKYERGSRLLALADSTSE